jgi:hypothetical protein
MLALLDRLLDDLSEDLGADNDVLVMGDDIAGTGQEDTGLAARPHACNCGLNR